MAVVGAFTKRDPFFIAVFVWAYFGILYKHIAVNGFNAEHLEVIVALTILMPVLIMVAIQSAREHDHLMAGSIMKKGA